MASGKTPHADLNEMEDKDMKSINSPPGRLYG